MLCSLVSLFGIASFLCQLGSLFSITTWFFPWYDCKAYDLKPALYHCLASHACFVHWFHCLESQACFVHWYHFWHQNWLYFLVSVYSISSLLCPLVSLFGTTTCLSVKHMISSLLCPFVSLYSLLCPVWHHRHALSIVITVWNHKLALSLGFTVWNHKLALSLGFTVWHHKLVLSLGITVWHHKLAIALSIGRIIWQHVHTWTFRGIARLSLFASQACFVTQHHCLVSQACFVTQQRCLASQVCFFHWNYYLVSWVCLDIPWHHKIVCPLNLVSLFGISLHHMVAFTLGITFLHESGLDILKQ